MYYGFIYHNYEELKNAIERCRLSSKIGSLFGSVIKSVLE